MATYEKRFLSTLLQLAGSTGVPISNTELRKTLGWQQDTYDREKEKLVNAKLIKKARGPGGSVLLPPSIPLNKSVFQNKTVNAFISYSHANQDIKDKLVKHLVPLQRLGIIHSWHDGEIQPGEVWDKEIWRNFEKAQIIILLISIDFINSEYCYDKELIRAMDRHEKGKVHIIPVIARDCLWKSLPFGKLQALPPPSGKAIATWQDWDTPLAEVAEGVRKVAEGIRDQR